MSFSKIVKLATGAAIIALSIGGARAADNVEVLHWWTSGGEAAALDVLKKDLESKGVAWADMPVAAAAARRR
jgi:glucose/mannose transport system substrate-binding protein